MSATLTPEIVCGLWNHLAERFNLQLVDKADAKEMRFVADFLEHMGILDADKFMNEYATTLGNRVYVPFVLGDPESRPLVSQACTLSHEAQHGAQAIREGLVEFVFRYLTSRARRAYFEAEALTTGLEVYHVLTDREPNIASVAHSLAGYALREADIQTCEKHLRSAWLTVSAGGVITTAGREAVWYLKNSLDS